MSSLQKLYTRLHQHFFSNSLTLLTKKFSFKRSSFPFSKRKNWRQKMMDISEGFIDIGEYSVFARSISGLETTVVVRKNHGHMDHISAVPQHVAKRSLYGMKMAKYYTPVHLTENLKKVCQIYHQMNETSDALGNADVIGIQPDERIEVGKGHYVIPFETIHRVDSHGYILYKRHKKLKAEFRGLPGPEIAAKVKSGEEVNDYSHIPEVAFTGDTTFEVFLKKSSPADLFRVKLLIVEATYIDMDDKKDVIKLARDRGHTHLYEIFQNPEVFKNIDKILLIHFSDKYSVEYIKDQVYSNIPESLKGKILISTYAAEAR